MSNLPKTYRAGVIEGPGQELKIVERELKQPSENQVLVKMVASSICYSDHYTLEKGAFPIPWPLSPGHEGIGRIVAIGSGVNKDVFKTGNLVGMGWNGGYCTQCDACRRGQFQWCSESAVTGITREGCHQEYLLTRPSQLVHIPEDTKMKPEELAPLLCAGITVFDALKALQDVAKPGDLVAIQGIGGLGHLAIQYAVAMGFRVAAISSSTSKRELALKLGAKHHFTAEEAVQELQKLGGAKGIVGTAPSAEAVNSIMEGLGQYGKFVLVGIPTDGKPYTVPSATLAIMRRSIVGLTCGCAVNNEDTVRFSEQIGIRPHVKTFTLDKANEGFQATMSGKGEGRNVIVFDQ